jgi:hypothetical protein
MIYCFPVFIAKYPPPLSKKKKVSSSPTRMKAVQMPLSLDGKAAHIIPACLFEKIIAVSNVMKIIS